MKIVHSESIDLELILKLQYLAYQSEAQIYQDYSIPPLLQTLEEVKMEFNKGIILKAVDDNNTIIGSVRGYVENGTLFIGKLIVHPEYQGKGIGRQLLQSIEQEYSDLRYELFTGSLSKKNLRLYEYMGYIRFLEKQVSPDLTFIYLEKNK